MLANRIDFVVPQSWHELTDKQLRYVYRLISSACTPQEMQLLCLLRWSGTKIVGRRTTASGGWMLRRGRVMFEASALALAECLEAMEWLAAIPLRPVRPQRLHRRQALAADFTGVRFELFLAVENLYQGYLATENEALLDQLAAILYPGLKGALADWERVAVFYWVASLKECFARRFSDFFQPASEGGNLLGGSTSPDVEAAMNAQIRALTKGDVTKEAEILALDTYRALTELNAQAREYRELNTKLNAAK